MLTIWIIERFRTKEAGLRGLEERNARASRTADRRTASRPSPCRIAPVGNRAGGPEVEPRSSGIASESSDSEASARGEEGAGARRDSDPLDLDLLEALAPVKAELRCAECGYGVVAAEAPAACPMCKATTWEPVPWRPFSRLADFILPGTPRRRRR
jgi:rubredoxin